MEIAGFRFGNTTYAISLFDFFCVFLFLKTTATAGGTMDFSSFTRINEVEKSNEHTIYIYVLLKAIGRNGKVE